MPPLSPTSSPPLFTTRRDRYRIFAAFWIYGLVNNVLYVIILSSAVDLVGADVPKGTVLLADVMPSFFVKLTAPYFVHRLPYALRIFLLVGLSLGGMNCVAFLNSVPARLVGVVLASLSSGLGELTFLQLTHFFDPKLSMAAFSSGTGGAGLVGSFFYLVCTTWLRMSVRGTIFVSSLLPLLFLVVYFGGATPPPDPTLAAQSSGFAPVVSGGRAAAGAVGTDEDVENGRYSLISGDNASTNTIRPPKTTQQAVMDSVRYTTTRLAPLFWPYMVPLMLVYIGEYVINQGIAPTLLYPLDEMPFDEYRDAYVTYGTLYQLGVFISRSSSPFVRVHHLYLPAILQLVNAILLYLQSLYNFIPSIYLIFIIIFYEGLLGGAAYVNTFLEVADTVPLEDREFALGAVGVSDSGGVVLAGYLCLIIEPYLCAYQKAHGRPYCGLAG
ncbi:CLN3 protein-domain-containing protein [Limtongia smithiae]|uniref:CLN3 protein-domain-containing protein n=1 Tax=Limtongia smithiae TaxID=1125753 RepID=UPI0034CF70B0